MVYFYNVIPEGDLVTPRTDAGGGADVSQGGGRTGLGAGSGSDPRWAPPIRPRHGAAPVTGFLFGTFA